MIESERTVLYLAAAAAVLFVVERRSLRQVVSGAVVGITVVSLVGLVEHFTWSTRSPLQGTLLYQPLGYANALGIYATIGLLLVAGLALRTHGAKQAGVARARRNPHPDAVVDIESGCVGRAADRSGRDASLRPPRPGSRARRRPRRGHRARPDRGLEQGTGIHDRRPIPSALLARRAPAIRGEAGDGLRRRNLRRLLLGRSPSDAGLHSRGAQPVPRDARRARPGRRRAPRGRAPRAARRPAPPAGAARRLDDRSLRRVPAAQRDRLGLEDPGPDAYRHLRRRGDRCGDAAAGRAPDLGRTGLYCSAPAR